VLEKHGVELIGADARAIRMAEDREEFAAAMAGSA
jgi:carbamoylphosphate synthase large subunit